MVQYLKSHFLRRRWKVIVQRNPFRRILASRFFWWKWCVEEHVETHARGQRWGEQVRLGPGDFIKFAQWRKVIQDPDGPSMGANSQIILVYHNVTHARRR